MREYAFRCMGIRIRLHSTFFMRAQAAERRHGIRKRAHWPQRRGNQPSVTIYRDDTAKRFWGIVGRARGEYARGSD